MELNGQYRVYFRHPLGGNMKIENFIGKCENFTPADKCVFSNQYNQMLIVHYKDIVQMKLYQPKEV